MKPVNAPQFDGKEPPSVRDLLRELAEPAVTMENLAERVINRSEGRNLSADSAEAWAAYLDRIGTVTSAQSSLEKLRRGASCVVTGQQAGVLTGPWLTVLKAAKAVQLAAALEKATDREVVPVFWVASDDHDLGEINHTFGFSPAGELQRLRLPVEGRASAGQVPVPAAIKPLPSGASAARKAMPFRRPPSAPASTTRTWPSPTISRRTTRAPVTANRGSAWPAP